MEQYHIKKGDCLQIHRKRVSDANRIQTMKSKFSLLACETTCFKRFNLFAGCYSMYHLFFFFIFWMSEFYIQMTKIWEAPDWNEKRVLCSEMTTKFVSYSKKSMKEWIKSMWVQMKGTFLLIHGSQKIRTFFEGLFKGINCKCTKSCQSNKSF